MQIQGPVKFDEARFKMDQPEVHKLYCEEPITIDIPDVLEVTTGSGSAKRFKLTTPDDDWTLEQHEIAADIMAQITAGAFVRVGADASPDVSVDVSKMQAATLKGSLLCSLFALFYIDESEDIFGVARYRQRVSEMKFLRPKQYDPAGLMVLFFGSAQRFRFASHT